MTVYYYMNCSKTKVVVGIIAAILSVFVAEAVLAQETESRRLLDTLRGEPSNISSEGYFQLLRRSNETGEEEDDADVVVGKTI